MTLDRIPYPLDTLFDIRIPVSQLSRDATFRHPFVVELEDAQVFLIHKERENGLSQASDAGVFARPVFLAPKQVADPLDRPHEHEEERDVPEPDGKTDNGDDKPENARTDGSEVHAVDA